MFSRLFQFTDRALFNKKALVRNGRKFKFSGNVEEGGYYHQWYQRLEQQGYPIVFRGKAYGIRGGRMEGWTAIFVAADAETEVYEAFKRATDSKLEKARFMASRGLPRDTFALLSECDDADEATKRDVLAEAYENAAERSAWTSESTPVKSFARKAELERQHATALREGKVEPGLMSGEWLRGDSSQQNS